MDITPGLQSAFFPRSEFYFKAAVCSLQSAFYTDRFNLHSSKYMFGEREALRHQRKQHITPCLDRDALFKPVINIRDESNDSVKL